MTGAGMSLPERYKGSTHGYTHGYHARTHGCTHERRKKTLLVYFKDKMHTLIFTSRSTKFLGGSTMEVLRGMT